MAFFRISQMTLLFTFLCFNLLANAQFSNKQPQKILVYRSGNIKSAPVLLLEITEKSVVIYKDNKEPTYINESLLSQTPPDFIEKSGGYTTSENDDNGYIFYISFDDSTHHTWGVFLSNYKYSNEVIEYTKKIGSIIQDNAL